MEGGRVGAPSLEQPGTRLHRTAEHVDQSSARRTIIEGGAESVRVRARENEERRERVSEERTADLISPHQRERERESARRLSECVISERFVSSEAGW